MRKLLVLLCVLLVLCGCHQPKQIYPTVNNISFTANIEYRKHDYICNVNIDDVALCLSVDAPETIKGLTFVVDKNGTEAKFKDISYSYESASSVCNNVAEIIYKIFIDINDKTIIEDGKNCKITDSLNGNDYELVFSPSGLPISLKVKQLDLCVNFYNVVVK